MTDEKVNNLIHRINLIKDVDPDHSKILNDCHEAFLYLLTELATSRRRYNQALEVIYGKKEEAK